MYYRVRIIWTDGTISVNDYTFSQVVAMLKSMTDAAKDQFWNKVAVDDTNGNNLKFVKEV